MPFCSQCGTQVGAADVFCGRCGARQPVTAARPARRAGSDPLAGINGRTASILCYIPGIGWIASIIVLASDRFRHERAVRFHAFQGLYLFVLMLMNDWVLKPIFRMVPNMRIDHVIQVVLLGVSIFMMVKASHDEAYALPVLGELAEKSVAGD
jgi:uncharacterized membrane protein